MSYKNIDIENKEEATQRSSTLPSWEEERQIQQQYREIKLEKETFEEPEMEWDI